MFFRCKPIEQNEDIKDIKDIKDISIISENLAFLQ